VLAAEPATGVPTQAKSDPMKLRGNLDVSHRKQRVFEVVRRIPAGQVATYGQVAQTAGLGRGARFVGFALRHSDDQNPLPWHRVIAAGGRIAFPLDSPGYRRQKARLEAEGVIVQGQRVDLRRYGWQTTLDAMLWDPAGWEPADS
jgi:methylated-DNA-protein-cysteine methyltransferase-like protein